MTQPPQIVIRAPTLLGHQATVHFQQSDGKEIDISHCVRAAEINLKVGDVNTVNLSVIGRFEGAAVLAEITYADEWDWPIAPKVTA